METERECDQSQSQDAASRQDPVVSALAMEQGELAAEVRSVAPGLSQGEVASAMDAGVSVAGETASICPEMDASAARGKARAVARVAADAAVDMSRSAADRSTLRGLGRVIPVLPGSAGAGASVVSAVIADVVQGCGWRVLLADTADPARSGLAWAAASEGPVSGSAGVVRLRFSWRGNAVVGRPETRLPVLSPGLVPPPGWWVPPAGAAEVTVVDCSYDAWRLAAQPLSGPGAWLRAGLFPSRPVLVVRATRPSVIQAERFVSRLDTWIRQGASVAPAALVVVGATRWPRGVVGAAGPRLARLVDQAVFVPWDRRVAVSGVGPQVMPARLRAAVVPLLRSWGLVPDGIRRRRTKSGGGGSCVDSGGW